MFLNDDYLLTNDWAKKLFHDYGKEQPISDYHCHLNPQEIYDNLPFRNLTTIWLNDKGAGDHYKWRLMRANGVPEELISGAGDDYEKFLAFIDTMEKALGNPIYEWSHLELRRYFGIDLLLTRENAAEIWSQANALLATPAFRPRQLIQNMNVKLVATTDDPISDLSYHQALRAEEAENQFKVVPTFRPDKIMNIGGADFSAYMQALAQKTTAELQTLADLVEVLRQRVAYFHQVGGRLADHGLNTFYYEAASDSELAAILATGLASGTLTALEVKQYQTFVQLTLMKLYTEFDWTMQMHMNVFRNDSVVNFAAIGPDAGFDSVGDQADLASQLLQLYAQAEQENAIPKSIWYSLNASDWQAMVTLMGSFQGGVAQKIQLGCAWWFNDTYDGMRTQLTTFAQQSLLGNFVGMLTDSRSFLSYPRHEYFRRVLCELVGEWVEAGRLPADEAVIGKVIGDICYNNADTYFKF